MCLIVWYVFIGNVYWGLWVRNILLGWGCCWYWCEGYWWIYFVWVIILDFWWVDKVWWWIDNICFDGWCWFVFCFYILCLYFCICFKNGWIWFVFVKFIWGRRFFYNGFGWRNFCFINVFLFLGCIEW